MAAIVMGIADETIAPSQRNPNLGDRKSKSVFFLNAIPRNRLKI